MRKWEGEQKREHKKRNRDLMEKNPGRVKI
jgi:hypothetical protein